MQKDGFTKKMIMNATTSFIIIIGLIYFIIIPSSGSIIDSKNNIEQLRINLEKKYIEGQNLKKISGSLKTIETEIPKLDKMFIKKSNAIDFITSLENIALKTGINQKINLTDNKGGDYQKNNLNLFSNGDFINQLNYLNELESMDYYINIKSMEISRGSMKNNMNMQIFSDTYWINY